MLPVYINKVHYARRACFNNDKKQFPVVFFPHSSLLNFGLIAVPYFTEKQKETRLD